MITAIVQFRFPKPVSRAEATELFKGSAPKYRGLDGLVRKYYLRAEDGLSGGGVYLWESKAAAERVYSPEWRKMIADRYGAEPQISYFETSVIVDNQTDEITLAAAE